MATFLLLEDGEVLDDALFGAVVDAVGVYDDRLGIRVRLVQHVGPVLRRADFITRVGSISGSGTTMFGHLRITRAVVMATTTTDHKDGIEKGNYQAQETNEVKD